MEFFGGIGWGGGGGGGGLMLKVMILLKFTFLYSLTWGIRYVIHVAV